MSAESIRKTTEPTVQSLDATRGVTLADLLEWAGQHVSPDVKVPRGRSSFDSRFGVRRLSPNQYRDIHTAANIIADAAGNGDPTGVGGRWFRWEACAGPGGRGDWSLCEHVKEWTHARARTRAEDCGKQWSRNRSRAYANKIVGAVRNLLDLAANHGWVERAGDAPKAADVYAGGWEGEVEEWIDEVAVRNNGCNHPTIARGVKLLAVFASRTGASSRADTDWLMVRSIIEQRFDDGSLARDDRNAARYVWRRDPKLTGLKPWRMRGDDTLRLVSETAIRAAVEDLDFTAWTDDNGRALTVFTEGRYGVSRWLQWASLSDVELEISDLPPRQFIDPTPNQAQWAKRRRKAGGSPLSLGRGSRRVRLGLISAFAGWASRNGEFDGRTEGLDVLCDPNLLLRYAAAQEKRRGSGSERRHGGHTDHGESILAKCLALIASPYLEAVARQDGDGAAAGRFRAAAEKLKYWGYGREPSRNTKKDIKRMVRVWSAGGRDGYLRLIDMVDLLIAEAEDRVGMTLDETATAIRESGFEPPSMWATTIRGAFLIALLRRIPYRLKTVSYLELDHWETDASGSSNGHRPCPWEGAIYLELPARVQKAGRPFTAAYVAAKSVGDAVVERLTYRSLIEAYLMSGGARDCLLTYRGTQYASPYLFPASAGHGVGRHGKYRDPDQRWKQTGIRGWLQRTISRLAPELGLDRAAVDALWGGATAHTFRALFGTYWEPRNLPYARVMLDHVATEITSTKYSGFSAQHMTLEVDESEIPGFEEDASGESA